MVGRFVPIISLIWMTSTLLAATPKESMPELHTRSREAGTSPAAPSKEIRKTVEWILAKTALVIVDMWDDHWCKGAAKRLAALAGPMNKFVAEARKRGVLIVHYPSTCIDFYKDTAARRRAIDAPFVKTPIELATTQRRHGGWIWRFVHSRSFRGFYNGSGSVGCVRHGYFAGFIPS
jgi:hypothetical protein